jgi:pilus assembly protein CpaB
MKNARAVWMLSISVVLGLAVTAMAVGWVSHKGAVASGKVAVAVVDIEMGSKLNPQMLSMVDWPSGSIPQGAFDDISVLQDRVVRTSIQRGEAILNAKLAPLGTQGGLSAVIAEGKRAMTVRVNDVVGVAGFALPGNYVDVMVNAQQDRGGHGGDAKYISKTVLEHVLVLAIAQEASRDDTKPKVVNAVTLELSLEDAEKLDLARNIGTLTLVLRNQVDNTPVNTAGYTKKQLLDEKDVPVEAVVVAEKPKPVRRVKATARAKPKPADADTQVAATSSRNCVEVVHNNSRAFNCF